MAQNPHAFGVGSTFYFQHLFALEFHEARMGEVKRDGDPGHSVRREPLLRQPNVGFEPNTAFVQFAIEASDVRFEKRTLYRERQIAYPHIEEMLIRKAIQGKAITHARNPFVGVAWFTGDKETENSGRADEKYRVMTTVIWAGNKRSRFRISGAGSL